MSEGKQPASSNAAASAAGRGDDDDDDSDQAPECTCTLGVPGCWYYCRIHQSKPLKPETDSEWEFPSPGRHEAVAGVTTPGSGSGAEAVPMAGSSMLATTLGPQGDQSTDDAVPSRSSIESLGSSVLSQTPMPAERLSKRVLRFNIDKGLHPKAKGDELKERKGKGTKRRHDSEDSTKP